jgi:hypothetical protein
MMTCNSTVADYDQMISFFICGGFEVEIDHTHNNIESGQTAVELINMRTKKYKWYCIYRVLSAKAVRSMTFTD